MTSAASPASSLSLSWLSWTDGAVLRSLAVFLPFADSDVAVPPPSTLGHHSSFLSLARTCKRAYELLTSDAECWSTQRLRFDLSEPLLREQDFVYGSRYFTTDSRLSPWLLRVDRFTARRQETLRRLIGSDAFDRLIAPRLLTIHSVSQQPELVFVVDSSGTTLEESMTRAVDVYTQLGRRLFEDEMSYLLPISTILMDVHWVHRCHSFLLLPDCTQLTTTATVIATFSLQYSLPRLLTRLPAVQSLKFERSRTEPAEHVSGETVWRELVKLLTTVELGGVRALTIDSTHRSVQDQCIEERFDWRIVFHFPPLFTAAEEKEEEESVDQLEDIRAVQRRLRLALCRHVLDYLRHLHNRAERDPVDDEYLLSELSDWELIERQLIHLPAA